MDTANGIANEIATRARSIDFNFAGMILPNPDPILKAQGLDIRVYKDLRSDAHVGGCARRRKSAVKGLEWGFERDKSGARLQANLEAVFADLDMDRLVGDCVEAVFYGYAPIEIIWKRVGSLVVPGELRALPQNWFAFDPDAMLRFRTRANPMQGELLPDRKFLLPRQDASYANPYGFPDLSMVFWPQVFKKGGMKFWLSFTEKWGTPFMVGKMPAGTPQSEMDAFADQLAEMVQDAVAVIPDNGSIEAIEAGGSASADLYERLVLHCRSEVSIALLGSNQSMEKDSNRASSDSGLEVADDLRDGDAEIVCAAIKQLAGWICDLNGWTGPRPVWRLWDEKRKSLERATRDKTVSEAGAKLTVEYFQREYGFEEGDLESAPPPPKAIVPAVTPGAGNGAGDGAAFAEAATDPLAKDTAALAAAGEPAWSDVVAALQKEVDQASGLADLQRRLTAIYGGLSTGDLVKIMAAAIALAELKGMAAVQDAA